LLPFPFVTRRLLALLGFVAVIMLAVALLYRVYMHHVQSEPYDDEEGAVVQVESKNYSPLLLNYSSIEIW
jgi:nitrogen fixation-related uncharacterized protein